MQYAIFHRGTLRPDNTYTAFVDAEHNVGELTKVKFLWNNNVINPTLPKLGASSVTVQVGETGQMWVYPLWKSQQLFVRANDKIIWGTNAFAQEKVLKALERKDSREHF